MSDEEEYSEEEVEEVEVEEEEPEAEEVSKPAHKAEEVNDENMTEAEKAMMAAKRRQEDDDIAKIQDYEARRKAEREKEEEELRALKEKQEQRKLEREKEEREMAELREKAEQQRKEEEEARKARMEAERLKKEEEKKKRLQMVAQPFAPPGAGTGGRNFVIPEKKDRGDKFGNIVQAKQEMGLTKDQQEALKSQHIEALIRQIDLDSLSGSDLKSKIKELHHRICKLETDKYDLEKRHERQEYDLKELNERQRQVSRNKALKKGLDPGDTGNARYPPKVSISSKYDRQIDRRNFKERRSMFDKRDAYPCFPNVPPPPVILEYKLQHGGAGSNMGDDGNDGNQEEVEEEEYEEEE